MGINSNGINVNFMSTAGDTDSPGRNVHPPILANYS